jgi:Flp pilus assembly protein TadG
MDSSNAFSRRAGEMGRYSFRIVRSLSPWGRGSAAANAGKKYPARGKKAREGGQSLVEFAITFPILMGMIFGLIEVCVLYYTYESMSEAAREGTRYAMVRGSSCVTSGNASCEASVASVKSYVSGLPWAKVYGGSVTVTPSYPTNGACPTNTEAPGCPVQVNVTYTFPFNVPFVPSHSISMSSTSQTTIIQ